MTEWSSGYEIGIATIDKDHRNLFELVKKLGDHIEQELADDVIEATIRSLILYVEEHFEKEERFMKRAGYPEFEAHKKLHDQFRDTIFSLVEFQKEKDNKLDGHKIMDFLNSWLVDHIMKVDVDYKPYVNGEKQGIKLSTSETPKVPMVNVAVDPEIHEKVQHFIKLISENTEEGVLIETAVEKITENQIKRRKSKARELFGK